MARTPNERTLVNEDLLRQFAKRNLVLNLTDRSAQGAFANNSTQEFQRFLGTAKVRDLDDVDGLETAPTDFTQASTTSEIWQISYVQGYAEANLRKAREMKAGRAARELQMNTEISRMLAEDADAKGVAAIAANTYTAANTVDAPQGNQGLNSNNYLAQNGIEVESQNGRVARSINQAFRLVKQNYNNLGVQGGVNVTGAPIPGFNAIGNIAVMDVLAEWLAENGLMQRRSDVAVNAAINRGVFANEAYRGTSVAGFNLIGLPDSTIAKPSGTNPWDVFVVPSAGGIYGAYALDPDSQGTYRVDGTHLERRVETALVGFKIFEPTWIQKITIKSENS